MEKRLLSYALLHYLKQGKCFISNCKLCNGTRNNVHMCRYITRFSGLSDKPKVCEKNTDDFPKSSSEVCTFVMKQQLEDSGKLNCCETVHSCDTVQPEFISYETSEGEERQGYSFKELCLLKTIKLHGKKCVNTLLRRVYLNMKENQLLQDQQKRDVITQPTAKIKKISLSLQDTVSLLSQDVHVGCLESNLQSERGIQSTKIIGSVSDKVSSGVSHSPTVKEIFNYNLYMKYQFPTPEKAETLSAMFPDPEKLLSAVGKTMRADENFGPHLVVTDHLLQRYWKAHLTLSWPQNIIVQGIHPDRDLAIRGAYLHMCEHLKDVGLIFQNNDGNWMPMTYDKVITILEVLAKYGESSAGCSRGRGFKIILKHVKEKKQDKVKTRDEEDNSKNSMKGTDKSYEDRHVGNYIRNKTEKDYYQDSSHSRSGNRNIQIAETSICTNNITNGFDGAQMRMENIDAVNRDLHLVNSCVTQRSKPRWVCTIHVGWPFPFSVQAEGLSLPAAQIMGYMSVISKLKIKGLLNCCNSSVSSRSIEHLVFFQTLRHWEKSLHLKTDKTAIEKFSADAEIFCDASSKGFGAFLSLKETSKVSWLSEEWDEDHITGNLHLKCNHRQQLHSMQAELFAVVTAVFTWKHKLRSRRLLCFGDNLTGMGFINSLTSEPLKPDMCKNSLDYLVHILQTTCKDYSIELQAIWLNREENRLADCLSRNDIVTFQAAVPQAAANKTKAKKLKIKAGICM